jgi:hypothetical protein
MGTRRLYKGLPHLDRQGGIAMTDKEFDAYFSRLDKASDSTRSIVYVFIIVYIAVLLYALNAFVYPVRQHGYDDILLRVECRYDRTSKQCEQFKEFLDTVSTPPALREELERDLWKHKLQLFYDDSVSVRTFQLPVFGITTDRDLLWIIFPLMAVIAYLIIWLALQRLVGTFVFIMDRNKNDPVRLRLILSTLMLTSPLNIEVGLFFQIVWYATAVFIFSIPIIVCVLTIADQLDVSAFFRGGHLIFDWRSSPFITRFTAQVIFLVLQATLLYKLFTVSKGFARNQREAHKLVESLDP